MTKIASPTTTAEQPAIDWDRFAALIAENQRFVLVSHIRPDCDALGSELGMAAILEALGKQVQIVNGQETPPNLRFIDPQKKIRTIHVDLSPEDLSDTDCFMILDTSARVQLGPMADVLAASSAKKIILDHHLSTDELNAEVFKRTTAEATGILVVEAADALGVALTSGMATPLFCAIATDTGWFRFSSVSAETYDVVARLVRAGAIPAQIYRELYERESLGRIRLKGRVFSRIELDLQGRLAYTYILRDDFAETGALPSDTEDLVNGALEIEGTEFAVIFIEQMTGGFKISFRSRCAVACNEVAAQFNGGGHRAAAGAFVRGDFATVQADVLRAVRAALTAGPAVP